MSAIQLVYYGQRFYAESGSSMSSVYTEDGDRYDWGFMQIALEKGESVYIRQATDEEYGAMSRKLEAHKQKRIAP